MQKIKSIAVYCGSSNYAPDAFQQASLNLGTILAKHNIELVFGGGRVGLMGLTARACIENGGKAYGVIPHFLDKQEGGYEEITELHYVESMHERKQMMFERADAFIVLPGGFGTLDELFEIMTWKQVGLHNKYIFIVDIDGYWSPIFSHAIETMIENKFIREEDKKLFTLIARVEDIIPFLNAEVESEQQNYVNKWA
jgi:conserved hypothetical protein, DprA/Smf-related, family 2